MTGWKKTPSYKKKKKDKNLVKVQKAIHIKESDFSNQNLKLPIILCGRRWMTVSISIIL